MHLSAIRSGSRSGNNLPQTFSKCEDHVTNGAPCGFRPEAVVMLRMPCVPAFSGVVVILKLTALLLLLELLMD
jgi:hypothetical protein